MSYLNLCLRPQTIFDKIEYQEERQISLIPFKRILISKVLSITYKVHNS